MVRAVAFAGLARLCVRAVEAEHGDRSPFATDLHQEVLTTFE
jgi:hypothetical protein